MPNRSNDVTDAELAVLQSLWDGGPQTIRSLCRGLYDDDAPAVYATVQKLLERLESKGCVRRDRKPAAHVFAAAVERGDLIGRRLQDVADKLCDGALTPLLTQLVRGRRLSAKERRTLRTLVDELDTRGGRGAKS